MRRLTAVLGALVLVFPLTLTGAGGDWSSAARVGWSGAVSTGHALATDAAAEVLGNAVDAAVVAALTSGVVDGHNSGGGAWP